MSKDGTKNWKSIKKSALSALENYALPCPKEIKWSQNLPRFKSEHKPVSRSPLFYLSKFCFLHRSTEKRGKHILGLFLHKSAICKLCLHPSATWQKFTGGPQLKEQNTCSLKRDGSLSLSTRFCILEGKRTSNLFANVAVVVLLSYRIAKAHMLQVWYRAMAELRGLLRCCEIRDVVFRSTCTYPKRFFLLLLFVEWLLSRNLAKKHSKGRIILPSVQYSNCTS